jgi:hypothetical protein
MKPKINHQHTLFQFDDEMKTQVVFSSYSDSNAFIAKVQIWDANEACTCTLLETITNEIPTVQTARSLYELVYGNNQNNQNNQGGVQ